jgi:hypothetical protein
MKALNRKSPEFSAASRHGASRDFWVCRVLEDCVLVKVESMDKLGTANSYMRRVAAKVPGSYLVFSNKSKRVVGRFEHHQAA